MANRKHIFVYLPDKNGNCSDPHNSTFLERVTAPVWISAGNTDFPRKGYWRALYAYNENSTPDFCVIGREVWKVNSWEGFAGVWLFSLAYPYGFTD